MRVLIATICFLLLVRISSFCQPSARVKWTPIGISGGGAMFTPAISPSDPNRMMLNCDMSGAYITKDGAKHWTMINHAQLRSNTQCKPAYHPSNPNVIYAANGWDGLKISRDGGTTWTKIGNLPGDMVGEISIDPDKPEQMMAGAGNGLWVSSNGGVDWLKSAGIQGRILALHFDRNSPENGRTCFAATSNGIYRSKDGGRNWMQVNSGLPEREILAFACSSNTSTKTTVLYCSVLAKDTNDKYDGGIFKSVDAGDHWLRVPGNGLNLEIKAFDEWAMGPVAEYRQLAASDSNSNIVYAFNTNTGIPPPHHASVYRSIDGGDTWRAVYFGDPRYTGCNLEPDYTVEEDGQFYQDVPSVAISNEHPDCLMLTDGGCCHITVNGGKTWTNGHTSRANPNEKPARWICNGLVVTTTWNYYVDPFMPERRYICYTDIGFAISNDSDKTWRWWSLNGRAPWTNTCYELAFDPDIPGKIWGAFSNTHDIPNENIISGRHGSEYPGGVCASTDHGDTWAKSNSGMDLRGCTSVVVDPRSQKGNRTLYAGVFDRGVYKSIDNGKTWTASNSGLGSARNLRVCRVLLHKDGSLFAMVTALRANGKFTSDGVGLYLSRDGAKSWQLVNKSNPLLWPKDFTVDPADSKIIYVSACDADGKEQGGLYRTKDGGVTWKLIGREGPQHFGAYLSPHHPGWIYMTLTEGAPGAGLWLSKDDGATWEPMKDIPFSNVQRITMDPDNPEAIYATTFGGSVWHGPASE